MLRPQSLRFHCWIGIQSAVVSNAPHPVLALPPAPQWLVFLPVSQTEGEVCCTLVTPPRTDTNTGMLNMAPHLRVAYDLSRHLCWSHPLDRLSNGVSHHSEINGKNHRNRISLTPCWINLFISLIKLLAALTGCASFTVRHILLANHLSVIIPFIWVIMVHKF